MTFNQILGIGKPSKKNCEKAVRLTAWVDPPTPPPPIMLMVVRRKTNVFLVRFMFICEAVWIIVNFIYLRKLFRAKLLVTSTGKTNISPRVETTWSRTNDLQH